MKKAVLVTGATIFFLYAAGCILVYSYQEKLLFFPQKLEREYAFNFGEQTEELFIPVQDGTSLNGLLFKADSSKGLVFYLHGNAGSLRTWSAVSPAFTQLKYDVFMPDYRGYGKSGGSIQSQEQLHDDMQTAYDSLKKRYDESKIVILGYSIGTGLAAKLAADNRPARLILQAPYYSLVDMMRHTYPYLPAFLLKYKLEVNESLQRCKASVIIFHGDRDEIIYYGSSLKLKELFKSSDTLITLHGQRHNGMTDNPEYRFALKEVLPKAP